MKYIIQHYSGAIMTIAQCRKYGGLIKGGQFNICMNQVGVLFAVGYGAFAVCHDS